MVIDISLCIEQSLYSIPFLFFVLVLCEAMIRTMLARNVFNVFFLAFARRGPDASDSGVDFIVLCCGSRM